MVMMLESVSVDTTQVAPRFKWSRGVPDDAGAGTQDLTVVRWHQGAGTSRDCQASFHHLLTLWDDRYEGLPFCDWFYVFTSSAIVTQATT